MKWPTVMRLPFILTTLFVVSLTLWAGGAGVVELVGLALVVAMSGAIVAVLVILAQGAHRDACAAGINPDLIVIERNLARRFTPVTVVLGLIVPFWFSFTYNGDLLQWLAIIDPDYVERTPWGLIGTDWLVNLGLWISGTTLLHVFLLSHTQVRGLIESLKTAEIDLFHLDQFQHLVRQPLRVLLIIAILASLNLVIFQFIRAEGKEDFLYTTLLPILALMAILLFRHFAPLKSVRDRIAETKKKEIALIKSAIRGDRQGLRQSQIAHAAEEFTTPDLIQYEARIQSIREWPIEGVVQRVLLYGLLPPLAWVLAALVERIVDAAF